MSEMPEKYNGTQADPTPTEKDGEKTFTQEDVNRIVSERLNREKERMSSDFEQKEKDFNLKVMKYEAERLFEKDNMPLELLEFMDFTDKERFNKMYNVLKRHIIRPGISVKNSGGIHSATAKTGADFSKAFGLKEG